MSASGCCPTLRAWDSFLHVHYCDGYLFRKEPSHLPLYPLFTSSLGTRSWPTVPKCTTTSTRSNRCSPWESESPSLHRHVHPTLACVSLSCLAVILAEYLCVLRRHRVEPKVPDSAASTDEENEDGDFTVYECPGLAPVSKRCILISTFSKSSTVSTVSLWWCNAESVESINKK